MQAVHVSGTEGARNGHGAAAPASGGVSTADAARL